MRKDLRDENKRSRPVRARAGVARRSGDWAALKVRDADEVNSEMELLWWAALLRC